MSLISVQGEQSTTAEIIALINLTNLATSGASQAIRKTGTNTFENVNLGAGSGTVTQVSVVTANGISGSVANDTTTPAITLILGAITPTSVNGLTITSSTGTLTVTNAKVFSVSNTLTLTATDGATLAIGGGGTLGTAAYTSASAYATTALDNLASVAINTALVLGTSDAAALGSATKMWSDLFVASGAVINFNNGDVTLTHSADTLTLAGGVLILPDAGLQVGASVPFSDSAGTLTLQNIDALDATTEATIETAIDTLANLTSIQGNTVTLTGAFIRVGAHSLTLTTSNTTDVTLPTTGTLATLAGTETLSGKTLTAPKIANAGFIADANGNELIIFTTTASAVNEWTLANGSTGVNPKLTASGEANVGLDFQVKGTGVYRFLSTASGPTDIRLFEDTDNGSNYASIVAPASLASDIVLTLPSATGTFATLAGTEELTNKTLNASVGKGTWTASGTWTLPAVTLGGAVTLSANITFSENTELILDPALSADGKYCGITEVVTAGEAVAFGDVVYLKAADSQWYLIDADADATAGAVKIAIAVSAGTDNNTMTVMHYGKIRADAKFPTLTVGAPVYLSTTAGAVQTAQPSGTDDVIRIVGHAITADELFFNPSNDYITHT